MLCKVCGVSLYKEITINTIFKLKYDVHESCKEYLKDNWIESVIPVESNKIIQYSLAINEKEMKGLDVDYIFDKTVHFLYEKLLSNSDWSVVIFNDLNELDVLDDLSLTLLLKLSIKPFVIISIFDY